MDFTKVICKSETEFNWYAILDAFQPTEKSEVNPSIYSINGLADLAVSASDEPGLSIHPGNAQTLEKVCALLSQAVSEYYHTEAVVSLCAEKEYFLQVII